jgi:hypothetical protein
MMHQKKLVGQSDERLPTKVVAVLRISAVFQAEIQSSPTLVRDLDTALDHAERPEERTGAHWAPDWVNAGG